MKPPPFDYLAPADLDEALGMLSGSDGDVRALAGGQSLIPMLNFRLAAPSALVDLNGVAGLAGVRERPDGGLELGAMVRQSRLERDPAVAARAPLLAEGAPWIAHAQIRSRGTIGGSVAHADPAAELPALLLALGASARAARAPRDGEDGRVERTIPLVELFLGPFFTVLEPDEIIVALEIPPSGEREGTAFEEVARRRGDYAIVGASARVRLSDDGAVDDAALALINAGPAPALADGVGEALGGEAPTEARIADAARIAAAASSPVDDMHGSEAYRRHLVEVLAARTLARAASRAAAGA